MSRHAHAMILAKVLALACAASFMLPASPALAQGAMQQSTQSIYQDLNHLRGAQIQMETGNAQLQADENARQRALRAPEQTAIAPGLQDGRLDRNTSVPLLFDDHKDVRHDTNDLDRYR